MRLDRCGTIPSTLPDRGRLGQGHRRDRRLERVVCRPGKNPSPRGARRSLGRHEGPTIQATRRCSGAACAREVSSTISSRRPAAARTDETRLRWRVAPKKRTKRSSRSRRDGRRGIREVAVGLLGEPPDGSGTWITRHSARARREPGPRGRDASARPSSRRRARRRYASGRAAPRSGRSRTRRAGGAAAATTPSSVPVATTSRLSGAMATMVHT